MDVKLPNLGEGADSGVVVNVFVKEGDTVAKDQPVLELENEKAVAAIPSTAAGKVTKVFVKTGDKVSVGQRLVSVESGAEAASVGEKKQSKPAAQPARGEKAPVGGKEESESGKEEPVEGEDEGAKSEDDGESSAAPVASPSIRRVARELGIDLAKVRGNARGGRVEMGDLRAYIQRLQKTATSGKGPQAGGAAAREAAEQIDFSKWGSVTKKPVTPLRAVIARRMLENWNAIPHVTQFDDAEFTRLNELRKKHAGAYEAKGAKLTLTPLILKAVAATLNKHPEFKCSLDEAAKEIVFKDYTHIGIAVDTEQGLIVPVLRDVDKKSVLDLAKELEQLAQKARDRKLGAGELKGGTFTISNQGAIGGSHFTPIINKPEVAILGVGRGAMKAVVRDGKIEARLMTPLALSYDHRVIDGGSAARFMVDLVGALEDFKEEAVKI